MHPFSVAELLDVSLPGDKLVRAPRRLEDAEWNALVRFGGFPDPFSKRDTRFSHRWNSLRFDQLILMRVYYLSPKRKMTISYRPSRPYSIQLRQTMRRVNDWQHYVMQFFLV